MGDIKVGTRVFLRLGGTFPRMGMVVSIAPWPWIGVKWDNGISELKTKSELGIMGDNFARKGDESD